MNTQFKAKTFYPILFGFFVMGFVDIVGIATNYVKKDFELSDTYANLLPMMVFAWFAIFSIPTGILMGKIGKKLTVIMALATTTVAMIVPFISYTFASMLLAFTILGISNTTVKQRFYFHHTTWKHWLKIFVLPIVSMFISVFLWHLYWIVPFAAREILFCTIALFIMNAFAFITLNYLDREQQLIQDNTVLTQNIKYQNDIVEAWATAYKNQRKMTHDFQNQLSIIYGLAECEAPHSELLPYIQTVMKDSMSTSLIVKTGRLVVDVLLSQKYHIAQSKGVHFLFQLDDLTCFGLKDEHLVVVLSNLVDNAIEACEKITDDKSKKITLVMKVEEESSFLYIENMTAFPVKVLDNQVVLPSKRSEEHGYGLKNVAAILNRYKAVFAVAYKEDSSLFCFSAQIPETLS